MMVLAFLRVVDLSSCSFVVPSFARVYVYVTMGGYLLQDDLCGLCKGRSERMTGRSGLCLSQSEDSASEKKTTLQMVSLLCSAWAAPVVMASASVL